MMVEGILARYVGRKLMVLRARETDDGERRELKGTKGRFI